MSRVISSPLIHAVPDVGGRNPVAVGHSRLLIHPIVGNIIHGGSKSPTFSIHHIDATVQTLLNVHCKLTQSYYNMLAATYYFARGSGGELL